MCFPMSALCFEKAEGRLAPQTCLIFLGLMKHRMFYLTPTPGNKINSQFVLDIEYQQAKYLQSLLEIRTSQI